MSKYAMINELVWGRAWRRGRQCQKRHDLIGQASPTSFRGHLNLVGASSILLLIIYSIIIIDYYLDYNQWIRNIINQIKNSKILKICLQFILISKCDLIKAVEYLVLVCSNFVIHLAKLYFEIKINLFT